MTRHLRLFRSTLSHQTCASCCGSCNGRSVAVIAARAWAATLAARRSVSGLVFVSR